MKDFAIRQDRRVDITGYKETLAVFLRVVWITGRGGLRL